MAKLYIDPDVMERKYTPKRLAAVNAMSEGISKLINSDPNTFSLGGDWVELSRDDAGVYLYSKKLSQLAMAFIAPIKYRPEKTLYNQIAFQNVTTNMGEAWTPVTFNPAEHKPQEWFLYRSDDLRFSDKPQKLEDLVMSDKDREWMAMDLDDLFNSPEYLTSSDQRGFIKSIENLYEKEKISFIFCRDDFEKAKELLKIDFESQDIFDFSENESKTNIENEAGKMFAATFDYLLESCKKLGLIGEESSIRYSDSDASLYAVRIGKTGDKYGLATTYKSASWLSVPGDTPDSWNSYVFGANYKSEQELLSIGLENFTPSQEIKNFHLKSADMWQIYCQNTLFAAIGAVQERLVEDKVQKKEKPAMKILQAQVQQIMTVLEKNKLDKTIKKVPKSKKTNSLEIKI